MTAIDTLARTIYGEARSEPLAGKAAVASVVVNRVARAETKGGYWWGGTIEEVCRKPKQFSCWNEGDPNRWRMEQATRADPVFVECVTVAALAIEGLVTDLTNGACHYHAIYASPKWARGHEPDVTIGHHHFYRGID